MEPLGCPALCVADTTRPVYDWIMQVLSTYRFTVDEYHRLGEAGILGGDDRVELLDGDLINMAPIGGEHRTVVDTLNLLLASRAERDRYRIGTRFHSIVTANRNQTWFFTILRCSDATGGHTKYTC